MKTLFAFDLDGTLAESKAPLEADMAEAIADLLGVAKVAVISGGDWPQFEKQIIARLPARADVTRLYIMPTTGTKLYTNDGTRWAPVYADLFDEEQKRRILAALEKGASEFDEERIWGERIEDRGSQITF
ncbi:MAG: HAD family hydrolase, partial [Sphingomonas sp.]